MGRSGCSKCFMIGVAHLPNPPAVEKALGDLRDELLNDPYFRGVPSMQPTARKTAVAFHAKDDLPEVRREVFKLLPSFGAKVQVAIRRKDELVSFARFMHSDGQRLHANHVYDDLVKRLFRNLLHKADENRICFAWRGKTDRAEALRKAIQKAKENFKRRFGKRSDKPTSVESAYPSQRAGLQVIDYYLWALQRLFERGEDRYFELLRPQYRLIMDLDDRRNRRYGEWYSDSNPLSPGKLKAF